MTTKIEDAFLTTKAGTQSLIAIWREKLPAERLAEVENAISAGGRIRMQVDGGLQGEVFNISAWLMDSTGNEVYLLFSFAPGEDLKGLN